MSRIQQFLSLFKNVNSAQQFDREEEGPGLLVPELELNKSDEELTGLAKQWEENWKKLESSLDLKTRREEAEAYWLGQHYDNSPEKRPQADNALFEALETFMPQATRQTPEPMVSTVDDQQFAQTVQKFLTYHADRLRLKLKMKRAVRHWALYLVGVIQVGWSFLEDDVDVKVIRPQDLILDPNGTMEEGEFTGYYIGVRKKNTASNLANRFPKKKQFITDLVKEKMGTELSYTQWWTSDYLFYTLQGEVLGKSKNPHWNYEGQMQEMVDEFGQATQVPAAPYNHFKAPKMPFVFLSVFNLGKYPVDDTSLIEQNLSNQDLINKRLRQIDRNLDNTNGGWVISGEKSGLDKEEAAQAVIGFRKGNGVWIPTGSANEAVVPIKGTQLGPEGYQSLLDYRQRITDIFGTRGLSPQGTSNEQTVRGKLIMRGQDTDRSSLVTEHIEQVYDSTFNWITQIMCVYYTEQHSVQVVGAQRALELVSLKNSEFTSRLMVSVKEGSLVPKDNLTRRNEAMDLWSANGIDPITLYDRLEFPNPKETAKQLYLWQNAPQLLFGDDPDVQMVAQAQQMAALTQEQPQEQETGPPTISPDLSQVPVG